MSLFTISGLLGVTLPVEEDALFPDAARAAYERLATLTALVGPDAYAQDPIAVLEAMAMPNASVAVSPLLYGYMHYALTDFRAVRIPFSDPTSVDPPGSDPR